MIDGAITFLFVSDLETSSEFYGGVLRLPLVVDQGTCRIYRASGASFIGICERSDQVSPEGLIVTLVTDQVDEIHSRLVTEGVVVESPPSHNTEYRIYQAFYRDPDGYLIEIQRFDDPDWADPL